MIMHDFRCKDCGRFEALVHKDDTEESCPDCGQLCARIMSAPRVGLYNNPAVRSQALKRRSERHSAAEAKRNPEALAAKMGGKPRAQTPWNIRNKGS